MKKDNKFIKVISYILIFFVGALAMYGIIYYYPARITQNVTKLEKDVTVTDKGIADAVEKVYDSVVVVSTYKDDKLIASGTGFLYKKEKNTYYVLTNHHVIENGNKAKVTFTNGDIIETKTVGSDQYADIAVLSFESKNDYFLSELGKSEDLRVGDTTFTVGAPLTSEYSWTVTRGILSGKDRMIEVSIGNSSQSDYVMKVLQTDAAINSGNSGGPLCSSNGEVVGITSLKLVSSGVEGMGFAIPIEDAVETAERIMKDEKIEYPYLGISFIDFEQVNSSMELYRKYYGLLKDFEDNNGVIVYTVEKGSAADKAGLKADDVIVSFEGNKLTSVAYLKYYLYQHNAGDKVVVTVYRDGKYKDITITLGKNKETA